MSDLMIVSMFFSMLLVPCLVAVRSCKAENVEAPALVSATGRKTAAAVRQRR